MGQRKWTRERVLREIRRLHRSGESLSTRSLARLGYGGMVSTARKPSFFGGWRNAIRAAGLDPEVVCRRPRKWTRERIVRRIRELWEAGEDLSHRAAKRRHQYLVVAAADHPDVGSWRAALAAAGLDYAEVSRHRRWSRKRIIAAIRDMHARGHSLSLAQATKRHGSLVSAASSARHFGSWAKAVRAAGLDYGGIRKTRRWTRGDILRTIRRLHREGEELNNSSMRRLGYRGMMEAARREASLGSWAAAIEAAGLDYDSIRKR
ncbi:MAG: hypothetical protein ACE5R4_09780 [Armatimonadota bacterium]